MTPHVKSLGDPLMCISDSWVERGMVRDTQ